MKKTTFKDIELLVSIIYDHTYMEYLEADGISYTTRTIPIFQSLLPGDTLSYGGYEISYTDENGNQKYVYPFITEKKDFTKCVTFFPENKLDNLYLLDLEQALRTEQLLYINADVMANVFKGFDFSTEIKIEDLLDTVVELDDGCSYTFTAINSFPAGITGKKILPNLDAVNVFLAKADSEELSFLIHEAGDVWKVLDKEQISSVFGSK